MSYRQITQPLLTAREEIDLAQAIETGSQAQQRIDDGSPRADDPALVAAGQAARTRFIEANVRLVMSVANRMRIPPHVDRQDVIQDGMVGLDTAVARFDWRRGYKFSTYATWWIRQGIQRGLENTATVVRIPAHKASELRTALATADDPHGLDVPAKLQPVARFSSVDSLDRTIGEGSTVADLQVDATEDPATTVEISETQRRARGLLELLDPDTARAVVARFGLDGGEPLTYAAIAQHLGVSPEAARRRVARALEALRPAALRLAA